jgi:hypothetical protein
MARPIPTPVAALVGLVPAAADSVRRLPAKAVTLPVLALGTVLTKAENAKRDYDALAVRGTALLDRLRGTASEAVTDFADDVAARADDLEDRVEKLAGRVVPTARDLLPDEAAADLPEPEVPEAEQPKAVPTPKAPTGAPKRVSTAASPANALAAELIAEATPAVELDHDTLPLADYDHMTLGSLRGRLRSLTSDELVQVRAYEKAHAARLPVLTMLDNRLAKLAADAGAEPTGGPVTGPAPEQRAAAAARKGGSKVSPATAAKGPVAAAPSSRCRCGRSPG